VAEGINELNSANPYFISRIASSTVFSLHWFMLLVVVIDGY